MANKQSPKTKTRTTKPKATKVATSVPEQSSRLSLVQKVKDHRSERKFRKADAHRQKQTDKARRAKAEQRAERERALEQVNKAVLESKKRKSRPLLTLTFSLLLAGLGAAAMYQYRQIDIDNSNTEIAQLQSEIQGFSAERQAAEAARQAEEDKFVEFALGAENDTSLSLPREWSEKPSSFPTEEVLLGDDNVTISVVTSETRNDKDAFIPTVDYLWVMDQSSDTVAVTSKSLHCDRFDTLSNDLSDSQREHKDFIVYCDTNAEKVQIAVLSTPDSYGLESTGAYFLVTINDIQQTNLDAIQDYIQSYK